MADQKQGIPKNKNDISLLGELWQQARLVFYLIKDREVPIYLKALPLLGVLYALFPIDLITDFVPVLGQLDDITLLLIGAKVFIELAPPHIVARYMDQMRAGNGGTVVEGTATDVAADVKLIEGELVDDVDALKAAESADKNGLFRR